MEKTLRVLVDSDQILFELLLPSGDCFLLYACPVLDGIDPGTGLVPVDALVMLSAYIRDGYRIVFG